MALRVEIPTPAPITDAPFDMGHPVGTPNGIRINSRHLERDGRPWMPVMGEYHFSRDVPEHWRTELLKMKAGGVDVVATYLLWILHEEHRGRVRWDGPLDLRRFVQVADEVGLKVMIRIGPWAHGETRNGGFPDWVQALPVAHRTDDPGYLEVARSWIAAIGAQVDGLFQTPEHPDRPIIGVQVDNELSDQPEHLATLRGIAESVGMDAPLWTATGWGLAQLPERRVFPVYSGYADGFWGEADEEWPAFGRGHFTFSETRDDFTVGADVRGVDAEVGADATLGAGDPWPFATCELGGGMTHAYHRRPLVTSDDVTALALTKLGSGSAWQGYYMYHGGRHTIGDLGTTQESHATGYPNDVPVRDYDFFAPIGAAGTVRPHLHGLRLQHLLMQTYADELAPTAATIPAQQPLRWSVRSDGERGFLFVNNHQPAVAPLPTLAGVRFEVAFHDGTVVLPTREIDIPTDAFFVWPMRQRYGSIASLTATAQPITSIDTDDGELFVFAAVPGIPVELQLDGVVASAVDGATCSELDGRLIATPDRAPGPDCLVRVGDTTLLIVDAETAASLWRGSVGGIDRLVLWPGTAWFDGELVLERLEQATSVGVVPALSDAGAVDRVGPFHRYLVEAGITPLRVGPVAFESAPVAPVRIGGPARRFSAPTDEDFAEAATAVVPLDLSTVGGAERIVAEIVWIGDVLRVHVGDELIADQFWHGRPLEIDLTPYRDRLRAEPLRLSGFAWRPGAGIHVDATVRPAVTEPALRVDAMTVRGVTTTRH